MYKIIIFGTGATSKVVESGLKEDINIVCYCDNDKSKWGTFHNNREVVNPDLISTIEFDYIIIASQFNEPIYKQLLDLGVREEKILQFFKFVDTICNYIKNNFASFLYSSKDIEVVATGISYMERAISTNVLKKRIFNLAKHSQDLYFDYHIIKYSLENHKNDLMKLKYVFIGLSYYSFEYDMSLSAMNGKVPLYYETIGVSHNLDNIHGLSEARRINEKIANNIFNLASNGYPLINWSITNNYDDMNTINEDLGKKQAILDGNKNYPETVKENIKIFDDYLTLLEQNNIKPIVIVCPTSKYYSSNFPKRLKDEFYSIVQSAKKEHEFQFIDYFNNDKFKDDDFYDVSHLNQKGAEKFTEILNELIEW